MAISTTDLAKQLFDWLCGRISYDDGQELLKQLLGVRYRATVFAGEQQLHSYVYRKRADYWPPPASPLAT